MENKKVDLTTEQLFSLKAFEMQVREMSREQAQNFLIDLYEQHIRTKAYYNDLLAYEWGLAPNPEY